MRRHRGWMVLNVLLIGAAAVALLGYVTERLWNWLMTDLFGLHAIGILQAIGLLVLGKLLFGGLPHPGRRGGRWNRKHMEERWANMSAEDRERFRAGMHGRRGWGRGTTPESVAEQAES